MENRQGVTFSELSPAKPGQQEPVAATTPPLLDGYTLSTLVTYGGSSILARLNMMEQDGKAKIRDVFRKGAG